MNIHNTSVRIRSRKLSVKASHSNNATENLVLDDLAHQALDLLNGQLATVFSRLLELPRPLATAGPSPVDVPHVGPLHLLLNLLQLVGQVGHLSRAVLRVGGERVGGEGADPVLAPQLVQQLAVQAALEVAHGQRVVPLAVDAEILDLLERDALVLRGCVIFR